MNINAIEVKEMDAKELDDLSELLLKHYKDSVLKFLKSHKDEIEVNLSKAAKDLFENDVLKKKKMRSPLLKSYFNHLSDEAWLDLEKEVLKAAFCSDDVLCKQISKDGALDEEAVRRCFVASKPNEQERIRFLFLCFGVDIDLSDEALATARGEALRKEMEEKDVVINRLKGEADKMNAKHKEELRKATEESFQKQKKIAELEKEVGRLNATLEKAREEKKTPLPVIEESKPAEPSKQKGPSIDFEQALDDLEGRTLLGVVKPEGIKPEKNWVVLTPIVPIVGDNANIDKEELLRRVDYRSDYSTLLLFLEEDTLAMILPDGQVGEYRYMNRDEKFEALYSAFSNKLLYFSLDLRKPWDEEKYKMNARLVEPPHPYKAFANSTYVPSFRGSKKEFESLLAKKAGLTFESYPYTLSSSLRYVFVQDTIYEVNYIPDETSIDQRYTHWKNNEQGDAKLKKFPLKESPQNEGEQCLFVPNQYEPGRFDLYVKNVAFIGAASSKKAAQIFDEEEFIHNVLENAKSRHLYYKENDLKNFHVAVKSSNLVILAGPSGIGKTKLPMVYASTLGLDKARNTLLFVSISPSYLEPEDVLGYIRPLTNSGDGFNAEYIESQTGLVSFLIDAEEHKDKIHLVIFDEMNLSQIEHWFAPFISLLEQSPDSRELKLYSNNLQVKNGDKYPSSVVVGDNVFFIGTVNLDETTKRLSDRLLDRAVVINLAPPSFSDLKGMGTAKGEIYPEITYSRFSTAIKPIENSAYEFSEKEFALLNELNALFTSTAYNKSISFRSLNKMACYLANSLNVLSREEAFDLALSQIVIKKINGSKEELDGILEEEPSKGLLKILSEYSSLGDFAHSIKVVKAKLLELSKYGFAR